MARRERLVVGLLQSLDAVRRASGSGLVDWSAAADAAKSSTDRGVIDHSPERTDAYRRDIVDARDAVSEVVDIPIELPSSIEILDRHHWIDRTAVSFERILAPTIDTLETPDLARTVNTGTASVTLGVLGRRVIGQYDPALFGTPADRALYLVAPNLEEVADDLGVDPTAFRSWVLHHELAHVAEFSMAPWLDEYLESRIERALGGLGQQTIDREAMTDLTVAMTVVEGFAELIMDEAYPDDATELREPLEARRAGLGPLTQLIDWVLGIAAKRKQYRRGRAFFETIADAHGIEAAARVWEDPSHLPTNAELHAPADWLARVYHD